MAWRRRFKNFMRLDIDPLGRPTITAGSDQYHVYNKCHPFVRPHFSKYPVDLAKRIINDTCLVFELFDKKLLHITFKYTRSSINIGTSPSTWVTLSCHWWPNLPGKSLIILSECFPSFPCTRSDLFDIPKELIKFHRQPLCQMGEVRIVDPPGPG